MTWITDFHERTDLNRYPVKLRTRGGIGYKLPNGDTVSNFVGYPVHYFDNGLWKPITLQPHSNGDFEGSDFSWRGKQVFYKGRTLFEPRAVILDGTRYKLFLRRDGNVIRADLPFGYYEIIFSENGVKELLTIPEPIDGLIEFDVPHANKPDGLFKKDRHIVGGEFGESFTLTKGMNFPLVIDPNYTANVVDAHIYGTNATYSTARSTSSGYNATGNSIFIYHNLEAGTYYAYRGFEKFDTSGIPDTDSVSAVEMSIKCNKRNGTSGSISILKHDWSGQDPISAGNRETAFDGVLSATFDNTLQALSSMTAGNWYSSSPLDTSWVNKTGYTYYSLANSNDLANSAPGGLNEFEFYAQDYATSGDRPYLTVTHAAAAVSQPVWFM